MTIAEFLLARIAEDERLTFADSPKQGRDWELTQIDDSRSWDLLAISHRRVLAECEAKRQIVERHRSCMEVAPEGTCGDLRALASVYADHPDYRDEWRP